MRIISLIFLNFFTFIFPMNLYASANKDPFDAILFQGAKHITYWHKCPEDIQTYFIEESGGSKEFYLLPLQQFARTIDKWPQEKKVNSMTLFDSLRKLVTPPITLSLDASAKDAAKVGAASARMSVVRDGAGTSGDAPEEKAAFSLPSIPSNKKTGYYVQVIWDHFKKSPYGPSITRTNEEPYRELLYVGCLLKASYDSGFQYTKTKINVADLLINLFVQIQHSPFELKKPLVRTAKALMDAPHPDDLQSVGSVSLSRRGSRDTLTVEISPINAGNVSPTVSKKEEAAATPSSTVTPSRRFPGLFVAGTVGVVSLAAFALLKPEEFRAVVSKVRDFFAPSSSSPSSARSLSIEGVTPPR